jgi:uncharacterized membrane protein (GlpM family)
MLFTFWFALLLRAAVSAAVVVTATVAAEAAGPFWGGLIVSLPIGAGPAYAMLALQHDAAFIADSALNSFAANASTFVFQTAIALLATRVRWFWALAGAAVGWAVAVLLIHQFTWDAPGAFWLNAVVIALSIGVTWPIGMHARGQLRSRAPVRPRWFDLLGRAALVGLTVGAVVTGSQALGPTLTGMAAVFPVATASFAALILLRLGGGPTAAIMASAVRAMPGFALSLLTLHLAAVPFGVVAALCIALLPSLAWSAMLMLGRALYRGRAVTSSP